MMAQDHRGILLLAFGNGKLRRECRKASSFTNAIELAQRSPHAADVVIEAAHVARLERWLELPQTQVVSYFDASYPEALRYVSQPPLVLFCHGDVALLQCCAVAIVGSRNASPTGQHTADYFARGLASSQVVIISGLAMGIDAAAHRGALATGRTIAVLAGGPDVYYPARNRQLQQQIAQAGLLVSEFAPGVPSKRDHFIRRNRIIVALAQLVLVVEAKPRSGSLNTAKQALEQNRSLFAVPGSIWDQGMGGCLMLLQQGAGLAMSINDVRQELNLPSLPSSTSAEDEINSQPSLANTQLLANVGNEVTSIDTIVARSKLPVAIVSEQLVLLELEGRVTSVAGGYIKVGRR